MDQETTQSSPAQTQADRADESLFVVGIGASAGGLDSLRDLLRALHHHPLVCYVVLQHLSPSHESLLSVLLARTTSLSVSQITGETVPRANNIYIAPPGADVVYVDQKLQLSEPQHLVGPKPNIDRFFISLAQGCGAHAVGVVLSGSGSDGKQGIQAIHKVGGLTIVQDPATAAYDSMPLSSLQSGGIDLTLSAQDIGEAVTAYAETGDRSYRKTDAQDLSMRHIIVKVRELTGIDLSGYKQSTLERRLARRLASHRMEDERDYFELLQLDAVEAEAFAKEVLISVTEFFRDRAAFERVKEAIRDLLENTPRNQTIRVWNPGCATGQETYSLAILFEEAKLETGKNRNYQIFATDLDIKALATARAGRFSKADLERVDPEWRDRYFETAHEHRVIRQKIRENILFSAHNLIQDPPFVRLDLVSCRNLLIYLNPALQKRVLELFHYALNGDGLLFLGRSESADSRRKLFGELDREACLFRRLDTLHTYRLHNLSSGLINVPPVRPSGRKPISPELAIERTILEQYAPPALVVNTQDDVVYTSGAIQHLVQLGQGLAGLNVFQLIRKELRAELRALLFRVRRDGGVLTGVTQRLVDGEQTEFTRLAVQALKVDAKSISDLVLVTFNPLTTEAEKLLTDEKHVRQLGENDSIISALEHDLTAAREHLQTVTHELESANEELQLLNEELQSSNEELQATNEELQTTNEELQSTNEELLTVNDEMEGKSFELQHTINDLQNVLESIAYPLLVVDRDQQVTRLVPQLDRLLHLSEVHHGDRLAALPWHVHISDLSKRVERVMKTGEIQEVHLGTNRNWYKLVISPYRVGDSEIAGAVLAFPEISEIVQAKDELAKSESRLKAVVENVNAGIISINEEGLIVDFNKSAEQMFGYQANEVVGKSVNLLMPEHHRRQHDRYIRAYIHSGVPKIIGVRREIEGRRKDGSIFPLQIAVSETPSEAGTRRFIGALHDLSEERRLQQQLAWEQTSALATLKSIADAVITVNVDGQIAYMNPMAERLTGWRLVDARDRKLIECFRAFTELDRSPVNLDVRSVIDKGEAELPSEGFVLKQRDGNEIKIEHSIAPIADEDHVSGAVIVFRDTTAQRYMADQLSWAARHDSLTGLVNRKEFEFRLEHALTSAKSFNREHALLYVDLDQFKVVNDTAGHRAGDQLLQQLSYYLSPQLRSRDTLARLGGDEFAVLLENCSETQAYQIANKLKEAIAAFRFAYDEKVFRIGASIGLVPITVQSKGAATVLSNADAACYAAKDAGRNQVQQLSEQDETVTRKRREMSWVNTINAALDENKFRLYFQRIDPLQNRAIKPHWELLLRMQGTDGELVSPGTFLPAAERYGIMTNIDRWVLRTALKLLTDHFTRGTAPLTSVNISGNSLADRSFLDYVKEQLGYFDIEPASICFEITETAAITNFAAANQFIRELSGRGCRFALDDFGNGMSSFGYLKSLPVEFLKIDGLFVKDITNDNVDLAMVEAINRIGQVMNVRTVGEFAEDQQIIDVLAKLGVDYAQGHGIAKPVSADAFLRANA